MRAVSFGMRTVLLAAVALLFCGVADPVAARHPAAVAPAGDEQLLVTFHSDAARERFSIKRRGRGIARANADAWFKASADSAAEVTDAYAIGGMTTYRVRGRPGLLKKLQRLADVAIAEADGVVLKSEGSALQQYSTWGQERITLPARTTATRRYDYRYPSSAGAGVDIFVIDTGIVPDLPEFEGRACIGFSAFGAVTSYQCGNNATATGPASGPGVDEDGHGTHVSGTCAGHTYGVAKAASIIAVQVLDGDGSGTTGGVLKGIQYAIAALTAKRGTGTGSVINLSLGGVYSSTLNNAVASAVNAGIVVAVAAGNDNDNANAAMHSPASEPSVLTVGAATISDTRASYSNYGALVDVFAPGDRILSVYKDGSVTSLSGTSMATPHVAGVAALLLGSADGVVAGLTSSQIQAYIVSKAVAMKSYSAYSAKIIVTGCSAAGCPAAA